MSFKVPRRNGNKNCVKFTDIRRYAYVKTVIFRQLWPGLFSVDRDNLEDARVFPLERPSLKHEIDQALESE